MRGAGAWAALCLLLAAAAQLSRQQPPERPVFTCGGILTGESGFIGSEGFPGVYPPNSKCTWKITVSIFFKGILLEVGIGNSGRLLHFSSGVRIWVGGKCLK
ncbi:procollagen C-endopeptidase enhancer 2 [Ursus americanus]|uniref:procollagen C-endopeptidase enhancer 2 n=1 Tax=Ursus americanus TaxID=9643 RepID=UPI001E67A1D2|nr:procollagen C-endopeptidase enhancer 2 [Ursus americanus]